MRKEELKLITSNYGYLIHLAIDHIKEDARSRLGDLQFKEDFKEWEMSHSRPVPVGKVPLCEQPMIGFLLSDFYNDKYNPPKFIIKDVNTNANKQHS